MIMLTVPVSSCGNVNVTTILAALDAECLGVYEDIEWSIVPVTYT